MAFDVGVSSIVYTETDINTVAAELSETVIDACEVSVPHLNPSMDDATVETQV